MNGRECTEMAFIRADVQTDKILHTGFLCHISSATISFPPLVSVVVNVNIVIHVDPGGSLFHSLFTGMWRFIHELCVYTM